MHPEAQELNKTIDNPEIYEMLSRKGKEIYFPKKGIFTQTAEAKTTKLNATIGIALEDDKTPMRLPSITKQLITEPNVFTYATSEGNKELREAWKKRIQKNNPSLKNTTSLPIVTNGVTQALFLAGYLFIKPGDKVIIADKHWENYDLMLENYFDAKIQTYNTFKNEKLDLESFEKEITGNKAIIILNFPNNPTGYTPTKEEAHKIAEIIKKKAENTRIIVICDDAYYGLFYEDTFKESIFSLLADLHKNVLAIKTDGATKEDYVWGFRTGFITFSAKGITENTCKALEAKTAGAIRANISNASNLSQNILLKALNSSTYEQERQEKYKILKERYEEVKKILAKHPELKPLPFNSGYFLSIEAKDPEKTRQKLIKEYETGTIAGNNILRIAYSCIPKKDIEKLFENINASKP